MKRAIKAPVRREAPPPSRWIRSRSGTPAYVVQCSSRDERGRKLYRLRFSFSGLQVTSSQTWTLEQLKAAGVRFLRIKPRDFRVTQGGA